MPAILMTICGIAYLVPFYNYFYRICLIVALPAVLGLALISMLYFVIVAILRKSIHMGVLAFLTLLISLLFFSIPLRDLRQNILQEVINEKYCGINSVDSGRKTILGGVTIVNLANLNTTTTESEKVSAVFINDTHCFLTVCTEEVYSCE